MKKLLFKVQKSISTNEYDYLVVGGGIIGLTVTRELIHKNPTAKIGLIEKYNELCSQASTNNSGVIHAGFYYSSDSLKAKFCIRGNELLSKYCIKNKISFRNCGKLVVARDSNEYEDLKKLYERGISNGVDLEMIEFSEAEKIEPLISIKRKSEFKFPCLFSKNTSIASQTELRDILFQELSSYKNISIIKGCEFLDKINENCIDTSKGKIHFRFLINCAGTHSDKIAKRFGFCKDFVMLPFKGSYLYDKNAKMRTLVYPVPPNMGNNFLGVHYTITIDGKVKIGPSAYPSFFRDLNNINIKESIELTKYYLKCLLSSERSHYLKLLTHEAKKFIKPRIVQSANEFCHLHENPLPMSNYAWGNPGIRAQLVNLKTMKLETDFILERDKNSLHMLNIISPGWTSSMAMAEHVVNEINN